jgi:hypothetical protein
MMKMNEINDRDDCKAVTVLTVSSALQLLLPSSLEKAVR